MHFFSKLKAIVFFIIGLFTSFACISYHPADISFNTAGETTLNWCGAFGAIIADLLWQSLGAMTPVLLISFFLFGIFSWQEKPLKKKSILLTISLIFGCWLLADLEKENTRYLIAGQGGYIGFWLGRWGIISIWWIRTVFWTVFGILLIFTWNIPIRFILMRLIQKLPVLLKLLPLIHRAEKVVQPLKQKVRIKKTPKKDQPPKAEPILTPTTDYQLPTSDLFNPAKTTGATITKDMIAQISKSLEVVLGQFGITGHIVGANPGPVVTLYEFEPAAGIKVSRVVSLSDEIALKLRSTAVRIAAIPGTNVIGIEIPNPKRDTVYIRELIESTKFEANTGALPMILGKNIGGIPTYADLAKMPHLLVAGTTGSGKSVAINTMILSLLCRFTPKQCRLILVDPKMVELSVYNNIPHLLTPVVTEAPKAVVALKWAVREMEDRYRAMSQLGVRNIDGYNQKLIQAAKDGKVLTRRVQTGFDPTTGKPIIEEQPFDLTPLPYIVMIVDEMSDLMGQCGKEAEPPILRLAQMARAVGIHLILATQRPSVDVITGLIKANFPTRISFQVTNKIDSRTILDEQGAEQLLGRGDMLYRPAGSKPIRLHGPFVSDEEVERVVNFWRNQGEPEYVDAVITDTEGTFSAGGSSAGTGSADLGEGTDLYDKAVAIVLRDKKVSTSYVQRQLRIGYNRAADLIDRMEAEGVISKPNIAGKREILVPTDNT